MTARPLTSELTLVTDNEEDSLEDVVEACGSLGFFSRPLRQDAIRIAIELAETVILNNRIVKALGDETKVGSVTKPGRIVRTKK